MSTENGSGTSDLEQKIIRQIEYYFGDFNIPRDKFLQDELQKDDGWVTLEIMTRFNRLGSLSKETDVLLAALRKSSNDLMEISEDGSKIRRKPEHKVPPSMKDVYEKYEDRTLFVKGFGPDATLDDIESFLMKAGLIVNVVMRKRLASKDFKGSVFVSFKNKEDSDKFLTSDEFKMYNDKELIRKLRTEYVKMKAENRLQAKAKTAEARAESDDKRQEMEKARLRSRMTLGALLELSGVPTDAPEQAVVFKIKSMMRDGAAGDVGYVETDKLKEGIVVVRFKEENTAAEALGKLQEKENGLKFELDSSSDAKNRKKEDQSEDKKDEGDTEEAKKEHILVGRVITGEEEETAWQKLLNDRQQRQMKRKGGFHRGGRGGGRPFKRGRYSH